MASASVRASPRLIESSKKERVSEEIVVEIFCLVSRIGVSPSKCPPVIGHYIRVLSGIIFVDAIKPDIIKLQSQLHYRRPRSALVLRRLGDRLNMWMLLQELAQRFAQDAHAAAVNYAHARHSGEECAVHESFDFARGVVHGAPDDVDLGRNALAFALQRD